MFIIVAVYARVLALKDLLHSTFKIFFASIAFQFASYLFAMCDYASYARNGFYQVGLGTVGMHAKRFLTLL